MVSSIQSPQVPVASDAIKIFIVEDEILIAENVRIKLGKLGYNVLHVSMTGEEAVKLVPIMQPDVILMDIKLGGSIDGVEAAGRIRQLYEVPIIFVTAFSDVRTLERVKKISPYGYIIKPFQLNDLRTNIELAVHRFRTEHTQKDLNATLAGTLQYIEDSLVLLDHESKVIFMNAAAEDLLGKTLEDVYEEPVSQFVHLPQSLSIQRWLNYIGISTDERHLPAGAAVVDHSGNSVPIEGTATKLLDKSQLEEGTLLTIRKLSSAPSDSLVNTLVEIEERDRVALAESLHEGIGQILSAAKMNLDALPSDPKTNGQLEVSKSLLNDAVQQVRRMTQRVMPNTLRDFGLSKSLEALAHIYAKQHQKPVSFEGGRHKRRLKAAVEYNLYRVADAFIGTLISHNACQQLQIKLYDCELVPRLCLDMVLENPTQKELSHDAFMEQLDLRDALARVRALGADLSFEHVGEKQRLIQIAIPAF